MGYHPVGGDNRLLTMIIVHKYSCQAGCTDSNEEALIGKQTEARGPSRSSSNPQHCSSYFDDGSSAQR